MPSEKWGELIGRVIDPGGVQELCGRGTEGRGRWAWWGWAGIWTRSERSFPILMTL